MRRWRIFIAGLLVGLFIATLIAWISYLDLTEKSIFSEKTRELFGIEDAWLLKLRWPNFKREEALRKLRILGKTNINRERFCESLNIKYPTSYKVFAERPERIPKSIKRALKALEALNKNIEAVRIKTEIFELWTIHLKPAVKQTANRVCIIQHGHGLKFFEKADELIEALLEKGIDVYLPFQPYMEATLAEYQIWVMGIAMDKQLMGLRIESTAALIEHISKTHKNPEIIFIGRSGGSMIGLYTSICVEGLDKLAVDYLTDIGQTILTTLPHCEFLYGLGTFGFSEKERFYENLVNISSAKSTKRFDYGYPDITSLIEFVTE